MSWPARIAADAVVRHQYVHAVDVVPTVYELLGIEPPEVLKGYLQNPIEGVSFAAALTDPRAPGKDTQFYTMLGQRSIYHQGWLACTVHPPISGWGHFESDVWELYNLEADRSQSHDVASKESERLEKMKALWYYYAGVYKGLPLDDRTALEQLLAERPHAGGDRTHYEYYPNCSPVPEFSGVATNGCSFTLAAGVTIDDADAQGVLYGHGGVSGGHALYVKDRRLRYTYNWVGSHLQEIVADRELTAGPHVLSAEFAMAGPSTDPALPGSAGTLTLYVDDQDVGSAEIVTQPAYFNPVGDGICVGRQDGSSVTPDYAAPFAFTGGTIDKVVVDVSGKRYVDHEAQVRTWFMID